MQPPPPPPPTTTDYASWTTSELIQRVTELEAQLRTQNAQHNSKSNGVEAPASSSAPPTGKKGKPGKDNKPAKAFDPSKYHTRLIALKFAYLGGRYNGFEHHSNNATPLPTVEEELWRALRKTKLIFPTHRPGQSEDEVSWEGCEYSKCGRTDRGVSAFGQVIAVRVRSKQPRPPPSSPRIGEGAASADTRGEGRAEGEERGGPETSGSSDETRTVVVAPFDSVRDELPYIQLINRVLPPDIRVLAWCPHPPPGFSARFSCKERRYRYFFTNPAYAPLGLAGGGGGGVAGRRGGGSGSGDNASEGWLDIDAMQTAAKKYEGLHDFRNLCKIDPSKQITNFQRRIFHAGIHEVRADGAEAEVPDGVLQTPKLYYFEVRGSAFLWHQVRHLVAVLFLVGQGYERPTVVDDLLDVESTPSKPKYEMASDVPLVLWDCIFPGGDTDTRIDRIIEDDQHGSGYHDAMGWVYIGDEAGGRDTARRSVTGVDDGKFGRNGIVEDLWTLWRQRKMDETLAWNLMSVVSAQGERRALQPADHAPVEELSARVFDGSDAPRAVGKYVPIMRRDRNETPEVVNARYAARKGLATRSVE